ncbi:MAG: hypothetical protein HYW47_00195 [Deltaproteobacteria bacterium]|nr:hypothetical protein [Deltaproteobacteria bacterium]
MKTLRALILLTILLGFSKTYAEFLVTEQADAFPEVHLQTEVEGMSYAEKHNGKLQEFRLGVRFQRDQSYLPGLQWSLDSSLWAMSPQEASQWFNISQAHLSYRTHYFSMILGRVRPEWGALLRYSPIQEIFPQFTIDPINYQINGLSGLYTALNTGSWSYELMVSPLYIPHMGGARYVQDNDDTILPASRWAMPLYYQFEAKDGYKPINYHLIMPNIKKTVLKNSFAGRLAFQSKYADLALTAADTVDPQPRLRIDPKVEIKDESSLQGNVKIYPEFYRQRVYGFETKLKFQSVNLIAESAYIKPENPSNLKNIMFKPTKLNNTFAVSYLGQNRFLKNFTAGLLYSKELEKTPEVGLFGLNHASTLFFYDLKLQVLPQLTLSFFTESDFKLDDTVVTNALFYNITESFQIGGGIDLFKGPKNTYWGQYDRQDRVWLKVKHVF